MDQWLLLYPSDRGWVPMGPALVAHDIHLTMINATERYRRAR